MRKIAAILSVLLSCFTLLAQNASYDDRFIDAVVKYSSGDIDKAISELNILHAADSTDAAVIYYLAKCELEKKRTGSAISLLEEAATLDPPTCGTVPTSPDCCCWTDGMTTQWYILNL